MPKKKLPPLGTGKRFKMIAEEAAKHGAEDPEAVAAMAGMKRYGKKKMLEMAQAGRRKKARQEAARQMRMEH